MDFEAAMGADDRSLADGVQNGKPARIVTLSRLYETTRDDLWDALTDPLRLQRWFAPVSGELLAGGSYAIEGNASGTISHCAPPEAFDLTWEFAGNVSWVRVRLASEGEGTRMTLQHIMHKGGAAEQHWQTYGPGATGVGWDIACLTLGLHVAEPNASYNAQAQEDGLGTEPGKSFLRTSAAAWGEAHAASGTPREDAVAAAGRTAKFYAGA